MRPPDYAGGNLVNLVAELERRLTATSASPGLNSDLAGVIPEADSYLFVLIDGLGDLQLDHPRAAELLSYRRGALDAPFSTQTSVAAATIATGLPPSQHGNISYLLWDAAKRSVVNTLFWYDSQGNIITEGLEDHLPGPDLATRLASAGLEAVVIQPSVFIGSPLSRVLYKSVRSIPMTSLIEGIELALTEVLAPGKLVLLYLEGVDSAAHAAGQSSNAYTAALAEVATAWSTLAGRLPKGTAMIGTADHGHVDAQVFRVDPPPDIVLYGDSRVAYARGDRDRARELTDGLPAIWVDATEMAGWWGPEPFHPSFEDRVPDGALVADDGVALLFPGNEIPLVGYHGGLTEAELRIPLLVAEP